MQELLIISRVVGQARRRIRSPGYLRDRSDELFGQEERAGRTKHAGVDDFLDGYQYSLGCTEQAEVESASALDFNIAGAVRALRVQQQNVEIKPTSLPERFSGINRRGFLPEGSTLHQIRTNRNLKRHFRQSEMGRMECLRHRQSSPFFNFNFLVLQRVPEPGCKPENIQAGKAKYQLAHRIGFQKQFKWQAAAPTGEHKIFLPAGEDSLDQSNR